MEIILSRAPEVSKGTYHRPVKHSLEQRQTIESVRRETLGDRPNKTIQRKQTVQLDALDLLLAGSQHAYTEAKIEDPYKQGEFVEGFVYVRALAAFLHEDVVSLFENKPDQIGAGAIIANGVVIEDGAKVGAYTELETGTHMFNGASVGSHSVLRKGSLVGEGAVVSGRSHIGQFSRVGYGATIGSMSVVGRFVNIGAGAELGMQQRIGTETDIGDGAWLDDSVCIGRHSFVGASAMIGEMTTIGDRSRIGNGAAIGAESVLGNFVRVAPGILLQSPTYAQDGEYIMESNLSLGFPKLP